MSQEKINTQPETITAARSVTVVALFVFLLSNIILNIMLMQGPSKYMDTNLVQSRDVFAFVDSAAAKPDVAFFGSSVVEVPLALMDNEDQYVSIPKEAEAELSNLCKTKKSIHAFTIEAGLISDQLLLFNRLLQLGKIGQHNVLAVIPRDFGDSRIPAKNLSDTYRSMLLPSDLSLLPLYHDKLDDWTNFVLAKSIFIYKNKFALSNYLKGFCTSIVAFLDHAKASALPAKPTVDERFQNSLKEYVQVYDYLENNDSLKTQMTFLHRLLSFCKENKIELILVNLPLTQENRALMKPGFYQKFGDDLAKIAGENSTTYLDLSLNSDFAGHDVFHDSAHLNKLGGQRLIEALATHLCGESTVNERASK